MHYPGSVSYITILSNGAQEHQTRTKKSCNEKTMDDDDFLSDKYPDNWAILMDKGYKGAHEMIRYVTPYKKPARGILSEIQENYNRDLSSARIPVENFFGRMLSLWNFMPRK